MKKILYELPSYLFSILQGILIFLVGYYFINLEYDQTLFIMITFMLIRKNADKPCHYKSIIKCTFFTMIIFISLFIVAKIDFTISLVITIVAASMLTEKGDIRNTFEHFNRGNEKKYIYIEKYVENHKESKELEKFEDMLKAISENYKDKYKANFYEIYKLKFYDDKSLDKIVEASNLNSRRAVINALDMIAGMFYSYMNLNNLDEELTIVS